MIFDRRKFIQNSSLLLGTLGFNSRFGNGFHFNENLLSESFQKDFKDINNRVWLGEELWSVPLEEWQIKDGKIIGESTINNARVNVLSNQITLGDGEFLIKCELGVLEKKQNEVSLGLMLGVKDETDPKSTSAGCYFGKGIKIGINLKGEIFIENEIQKILSDFDYTNFELTVKGNTLSQKTILTFTIKDQKGNIETIKKETLNDISGLVSFNLFDKGIKAWYNKIEIKGTKIKQKAKENFGPIFWCMYTLSKQTLKLTAQLPPISKNDSHTVQLEFLQANIWTNALSAQLDPDAYTAVFKIENWNISVDIPYRIVYNLDGKTNYYTGTIKAEPKNKTLKLGALTCQHAMGFPYRPLVENLQKTDPDLLYFSGDQIYEENGGYPIKRAPEEKAILSYLGKYYMFGWAFGNIMKDRPTVCTPDDHDVFQGNLWGENGKLLSIEEWESQRDAQGGLVQSAKMINVVNRTQCAHLPEPFHSALTPSGISTWYTDLSYGGVSFAIVSDRMFKSGPEMIRKGLGRIDHVTTRLKSNELESEELSMMGNPQMNFLNNWVEDWQGVNMKVLLSQTLFANVATHHGPKKEFLFGDLDSGGWPKTQRDQVLRLLQKAAVFHVNGDQHLPFIVQYSIDKEQDGGWTFCTPAVSTGYPRWSKPDQVNIPYTKRPDHKLPNTGLYQDIFGNDNFVFAVGNPEEEFDFETNRYKKAQMKASGFGLITLEIEKRTIKMEAIRFLADLSKQSLLNTYPGWPLSIKQKDNDGRRVLGFLPKIKTRTSNQLIKIYKQNTEELVSVTRIIGNTHKPMVFSNDTFMVIIGEQNDAKVFKDIKITNDPNQEISL